MQARGHRANILKVVSGKTVNLDSIPSENSENSPKLKSTLQMLRNLSPAELRCSYCHLLYRWRGWDPSELQLSPWWRHSPHPLTGDLKQTQEVLLSCPQPLLHLEGWGRPGCRACFPCSRHGSSSGAGWVTEMPSERPGRFSRHWGMPPGSPWPYCGQCPPVDSQCSKPVCPSSGSEGLSPSVVLPPW